MQIATIDLGKEGSLEMQLKQEDSFVCYSSPGEVQFRLIQGKVSEITLDQIPEVPGFIISRFHNDNKAFFIQNDLNLLNPNFEFKVTANPNPIEMSKRDYLEICTNYIERCDIDLEKIILSRVSSAPYKSNPEKIFHALRESYPNAFVYLIHSPQFGTWLGATPEKLLVRKNTCFSTMALAGTKSIESAAEWTEKERHEQHLVTAYISQQLNKLGIHYDAKGPFDLQAGNVVHLCTTFDFSTDLKREKIIDSLHPTPAVCGMPRELAKRVGKSAEPHDRELYCGFLGPINQKGTDDLFVNLRCIKLGVDRIYFYAGGGITKDSVPEEEWRETKMKVATILGVVEKL